MDIFETLIDDTLDEFTAEQLELLEKLELSLQESNEFYIIFEDASDEFLFRIRPMTLRDIDFDDDGIKFGGCRLKTRDILSYSDFMVLKEAII